MSRCRHPVDDGIRLSWCPSHWPGEHEPIGFPGDAKHRLRSRFGEVFFFLTIRRRRLAKLDSRLTFFRKKKRSCHATAARPTQLLLHGWAGLVLSNDSTEQAWGSLPPLLSWAWVSHASARLFGPALAATKPWFRAAATISRSMRVGTPTVIIRKSVSFAKGTSRSLSSRQVSPSSRFDPHGCLHVCQVSLRD